MIRAGLKLLLDCLIVVGIMLGGALIFSMFIEEIERPVEVVIDCPHGDVRALPEVVSISRGKVR